MTKILAFWILITFILLTLFLWSVSCNKSVASNPPMVKYHITIAELKCNDPAYHDTMPSIIRCYGQSYLIPAVEPLRIACQFPFYPTSGYRPHWIDVLHGRLYFSEHESLWAVDIAVNNSAEMQIVIQYLPLYCQRYGISVSGYWWHFGIGEKFQPNFFKVRHWTYD